MVAASGIELEAERLDRAQFAIARVPHVPRLAPGAAIRRPSFNESFRDTRWEAEVSGLHPRHHHGDRGRGGGLGGCVCVCVCVLPPVRLCSLLLLCRHRITAGAVTAGIAADADAAAGRINRTRSTRINDRIAHAPPHAPPHAYARRCLPTLACLLFLLLSLVLFLLLLLALFPLRLAFPVVLKFVRRRLR